MLKRPRTRFIVAALLVLFAASVAIRVLLPVLSSHRSDKLWGNSDDWVVPEPSRVITACSPDGHFRMEVTVTDARQIFAGGDMVGDWMGNVTYALYKSDSDDAYWEHEEAPSNWCPFMAVVNDHGWTAVFADYDMVRIFDPTGAMFGTIHFLDVVPRGELDKYVGFLLDAGYGGWPRYSLWYFTSVNGGPFFCIRTWWDRRVVVDLKAGAIVEEPFDGALLKALESAEREFVMRTLQRAVSERDGLRRQRTEVVVGLSRGVSAYEKAEEQLAYQLLVAAHLVRRMKIEEALPLIEELKDVLIGLRWQADEREFDRREKDAQPEDSWNLWPLWQYE